MGYVERVLQPGESVLARARLHWWAVWRRVAPLALIALGLAVLGFTQQDSLRLALLAAAGLAVLAAILSGIGPAIARATTELAVTNRRIILKRGLIRRHTIEMSRAQVESVDVEQSMLGRLLDFGDVTVRGTGATPEPFRRIAAPLRFRSAITAGDS